jgi:superkiller protein 3
MRTTRIVLLTAACGLLAWPLHADKKLDDAVAKAEDQIGKGKVEEAAKTIQKMLEPPTAEGHVAAARLQVRMGKVEDAAATAAKGAQLGSSTPEAKAAALAMLSSLDLLRGSGKDALKHAQEAVAAQATPAALAAQARAHVRVGDAAGAIAAADKAVAAGATADALEAQGEALLANGKAAEAQAAFGKALAADPKLTAARIGTARALLAQNKAADAVAEGRKAVEENSNDAEAHAVLGLALLAQGNWSEAIASAQEGKFKNGRNVMVLYAVGKIFEDPKSGNLAQADANYKEAAAVDPEFAPLKLSAITNLERQQKYDGAIELAKPLADANPQNAEIQTIYGRLLVRKGDFLAAVNPLEVASKASPNNAEVQAMYGTALFNARQQAEALEAYKKAVALAPANVDYQTTYGLLLGMADKFAEGIAVLEKVVGTPGYKNAAGYTNLGWVYRNIDPPQADKAVAAYGKALELDPKNGQAALGLGWALSYARKYDEAIAAFTKATSLDAKLQGEALNGTAWAQYFKKDMASAKATANRAKELGRNVAGLLTAIDKVEKGQAAADADAEARAAFAANQKATGGGSSGGGIDSAASKCMRGSPADRRAGCGDLAKFGGPAVEYLVYAVVNDRDFSVRAVAANSLGSIGGAAKSACVQLRNLANNNPYEKTIMTPEEQRQFVAYEDLRKSFRAAVAKIGC